MGINPEEQPEITLNMTKLTTHKNCRKNKIEKKNILVAHLAHAP